VATWQQVTSDGQRTYPRGQIYGKVRVARTRQAEAIPGSALARARVLRKKTQQEKGGVGSDKGNRRKKQTKKEKEESPATPHSAITSYGTVNKTPAKHCSIERVL